MMKASEIFDEFGGDYKWLTRDSDGYIHLWDEKPKYIDRNFGCWLVEGNLLGGIWIDWHTNVDEFENLDWKDCIIEKRIGLLDGVELVLSTKTNDNDLTKLCKQFVRDFELDYVDDNKYVDNPPMMLMDYYVKFKQLLSK